MSRFLLVELDPDQTVHEREAMFHLIAGFVGVRQVIDLSVVSQPTLDTLLLAEPVAVQRRRKKPAA